MNTGSPALHVVSTVAMKGLLDCIAPDFEISTGCRLDMTYGPSGTALRHLQLGSPADVIILGSEAIDHFIELGLVVRGSQQAVAYSSIGIAVKRGAAKPRIDTVDDFKAVLRSAKSVAYTDPGTGASSGVHVASLLKQFGMLDEVNSKTKFGDGGLVARYVTNGEAEIAIQQICEHMLVEGVDVVGPLPDELQKITKFNAAILTRSEMPEVAQMLVRVLVASESQLVVGTYGLRPVMSA